MTKYALIVGINAYPTAPLKGCVNDATRRRQTMITRYGFAPENVTMILDADATTANLKDTLLSLKSRAQTGDLIHFSYSGHGSYIPSRTEADGTDETLCPVDFDGSLEHMLLDDWFHDYLVDFEAEFTAFFDSCHSGTGLRDLSAPRLRYLPNPGLEIVGGKRGIIDWFRGRSVIEIDATLPPRVRLFAGCQPDQTSADIVNADGIACGAFSDAVEIVLASRSYVLTHSQLIEDTAARLRRQRYRQVPQFNGRADDLNTSFRG